MRLSGRLARIGQRSESRISPRRVCHGLILPNIMDGPAHITQEPIENGEVYHNRLVDFALDHPEYEALRAAYLDDAIGFAFGLFIFQALFMQEMMGLPSARRSTVPVGKPEMSSG